MSDAYVAAPAGARAERAVGPRLFVTHVSYRLADAAFWSGRRASTERAPVASGVLLLVPEPPGAPG